MADDEAELICPACKRIVGTAQACIKCKKFVHAICGRGNEDEEKYGQKITCFSCSSGVAQAKKGMEFFFSQTFYFFLL